MVSVHDELWRKLNGETLEKTTRELQEDNRYFKKDNSYVNAEKTQEKKTMLPTERNSKMAVQYMKRIREDHERFETIHQDLLNTLKGRDDNGLREAMRKLEIKLKYHDVILKELHKELTVHFKHVKEKETKQFVDKELLSYHVEDNGYDDQFVPRNLFLNGVDTFKFIPKVVTGSKVDSEEEVEPSTSRLRRDEKISLPPLKLLISSNTESEKEAKPSISQTVQNEEKSMKPLKV